MSGTHPFITWPVTKTTYLTSYQDTRDSRGTTEWLVFKQARKKMWRNYDESNGRTQNWVQRSKNWKTFYNGIAFRTIKHDHYNGML